MSSDSRLIWYGAKTIFAHDDIAARQGKPCYEERVVLLQAEDDDQALLRAEEEAARYAPPGGPCRYLGYANVFQMSDAHVSAGTEVFSIMRSIDLPERRFLDRYYDDGSFHTR